MAYTAYGFEGSMISTRSIGQVTQFTFVTFHTQLGLFGFYSMILFGAVLLHCAQAAEQAVAVAWFYHGAFLADSRRASDCCFLI